MKVQDRHLIKSTKASMYPVVGGVHC